MSLNLHTFTSVFSTNLLYVGLPRKAFPGKQAKVDTGHQWFSVVAQRPKIRPRPAQWLFSNERTWQDNWTHCSNECWMKVGEGRVCWVQLANMCQHCISSAVQRETAFVEESWWPELNLFGSMPWCSFPWHELSNSLQFKFDPEFTFTYIYIRVFNQLALCRFA